jgi:isoamylase
LTTTRAVAGSPTPLGAHWDGAGTNFALTSSNAESVELCLFAELATPVESTRVALPGRTDDVFHGYVPGVQPGQLYGYRVRGPWAPERGMRFNARKLLIDPYARAVAGDVRYDPALLAHDVVDPALASALDSAPFMPRGLVVDPSYDWGDDAPPRVPWNRTLLYECHVKGMTMRHPEVPEAMRGRYAGLAHPALLEHFRALGVTTLSILPVHQSAPDAHVAELGLTNYWGYAPLAFLAPDARFASGDMGEQIREFREMVRALHRAGLEVLIDVVFNHTAEADPRGPTYSLRGIDNATYYRLDPANLAEYEDWSGCGNTLDVRQPRTLQLIVDTLRHWVRELHVDGFRFDLATVLGRDPRAFDTRARFFEIVRQDPTLQDVKLVAEPWDARSDGYALGRFPRGFSEWNDRFRDVTRRFWRGDAGTLPELATRLAGSQDVFTGRTPQASVNYVTCHDGMTLEDVVSYARKHNDANREGNRDGADENWSSGHGAEGPTALPRVKRARERAKRNLVATLAFSLGVPMLSHGDELSRSQAGNNNAYCQDNGLTWLDWSLDDERRAFLEFVRSAFALRQHNPVFASTRFLDGGDKGDVVWLRADGLALTDEDWRDPRRHALGMWLAGEDASELLLVNGGGHGCFFTLPEAPRGGRWHPALSSACQTPGRPRRGRVRLAARSFTWFSTGTRR